MSLIKYLLHIEDYDKIKLIKEIEKIIQTTKFDSNNWKKYSKRYDIHPSKVLTLINYILPKQFTSYEFKYRIRLGYYEFIIIPEKYNYIWLCDQTLDSAL